MPLIIANPLLTTKQLDADCFFGILRLVHEHGSARLPVGVLLDQAVALHGRINSRRTSYADYVKPTVDDISSYWLLGFIEAEGTVGFKNLLPYIQVPQLHHNQALLDAIAMFLKQLPNKGPITCLEAMHVSWVTNHRTNVVTLTVTSNDYLYSVIMPWLRSLSWQSRKYDDFVLWCVAVEIVYTGQYYSYEGRQLLISIAAHMNDGRYSNHLPAPVPAPSADHIQQVLSSTPLLVRSPHQSQLEFGKTLARTFPRQVYVYDGNTLLNGKPFEIMADAAVSVGLPRTSRIVSRYMDTGKLYAGRYFFTSLLILYNKLSSNKFNTVVVR